MGRYTGPSCRLCRRAGEKLFLKGDRCFTPRCAVEKRRNPPGNVSRRRRRPSDYGVHLLEKQKAKYIYGVLESQFRRYMTEAFNTPGVTGLNLLRTLERRLDNVIFLLGFADSRKQARQMVLHGHFKVNGVKTDIPSYLVKEGNQIGWKESDKATDYYKERTDGLPKKPVPAWLMLDTTEMSGQVISMPADEDLKQTIDSRLIVEFYSR
ncbi:MAG: 30S ribosomal protein S4 [SAR202 cluster bacterium Io17-Chloro-G2]|nr:MAG: 30S ribosomal protein S4 [SAR202 cluster bacterium Io17-Chloro-G2]